MANRVLCTQDRRMTAASEEGKRQCTRGQHSHMLNDAGHPSVDYLMEGSVRRDGERVRISVQLIRVSDQTHLWAENYQRDVRDILELQSEVATAVARETSVQLSPQGRALLASIRPWQCQRRLGRGAWWRLLRQPLPRRVP